MEKPFKKNKQAILFYFVYFLFSATSCSRQYVPLPVGPDYVTLLPEDPIYKYYPKDLKHLGEEGEEYTKRESVEIEAVGIYKPLKGETFLDFKARLFNTLTLQDYEKKQLLQAIERKQKDLTGLEQHYTVLQTKHVDLRLKLAALNPDQNKDAVSDALFTRYRVQAGDTLQKISYEFLNTYKGWLGIYRFNLEKLSNGPNRIRPGDWLIIPKIDLEKSLFLHKQMKEKLAQQK